MVRWKEGIPVEDQCLVYGGKILSNGLTLHDYNILSMSTLELCPRITGGMKRSFFSAVLESAARFVFGGNGGKRPRGQVEFTCFCAADAHIERALSETAQMEEDAIYLAAVQCVVMERVEEVLKYVFNDTVYNEHRGGDEKVLFADQKSGDVRQKAVMRLVDVCSRAAATQCAVEGGASKWVQLRRLLTMFDPNMEDCGDDTVRKFLDTNCVLQRISRTKGGAQIGVSDSRDVEGWCLQLNQKSPYNIVANVRVNTSVGGRKGRERTLSSWRSTAMVIAGVTGAAVPGRDAMSPRDAVRETLSVESGEDEGGGAIESVQIACAAFFTKGDRWGVTGGRMHRKKCVEMGRALVELQQSQQSNFSEACSSFALQQSSRPRGTWVTVSEEEDDSNGGSSEGDDSNGGSSDFSVQEDEYEDDADDGPNDMDVVDENNNSADDDTEGPYPSAYSYVDGHALYTDPLADAMMRVLGLDGQMTKPVSSRELCVAMSRQIDRVGKLGDADKSGDDVINSIAMILVARDNPELIAALFAPSSESWQTGSLDEARRVWGLLGKNAVRISAGTFSNLLNKELNDAKNIREVDLKYKSTIDEDEDRDSDNDWNKSCHSCRHCVGEVSDDDVHKPCMRGADGSLTGPLTWSEYHVNQLSKPLASRNASWWILIGLRPPTDSRWWAKLDMLPPTQWRYLGGGVGAGANDASIRSDLHASFSNVFTVERSASLGADLTSGRHEALSGNQKGSSTRTVRPLQPTPYIQVRLPEC